MKRLLSILVSLVLVFTLTATEASADTSKEVLDIDTHEGHEHNEEENSQIISEPISGEVVGITPAATEVEQPCVWTFTYDSTQHWEQCSNHSGTGTWNTVAHTNGRKTSSISGHNIVRTGTADCDTSVPAQQEYCSHTSCGYSGTYRKPHGQPTTAWHTDTGSKNHFNTCTDCGNRMNSTVCKTSTGIDLSASCSGGTCATCKYAHPRKHSYGTGYGLGDILCSSCGTKFGSVTKYTVTWVTDTTVTLEFAATLTNAKLLSASIYPITQYCAGGVGAVLSSSGISVNSTSFSFKIQGTIPRLFTNYFNLNGDLSAVANDGTPITALLNRANGLYADITAPSHTSTTLPPMSTWSNNASLSTTWFDGFTDMVQIGLMNNAETQWLVPYGNANPSGTSFLRSFLLSVEAPAAGVPFKLKARDVKGNVGTHTITLRNIDALPPAFVSLTNDTTNWAQSKTVRLTVNDAGIGQVKMSLDGTGYADTTTQSGTQYYKEYTFTSEGSHSIYYRDGLLNAGVQAFNVTRIDRIAPTATCSSPTAWTNKPVIITVTGADTQSGVNTIRKPDGTTVTATSTTYQVSSNGTYQFLLTDKAGNTYTISHTVSCIDPAYPMLNVS